MSYYEYELQASYSKLQAEVGHEQLRPCRLSRLVELGAGGGAGAAAAAKAHERPLPETNGQQSNEGHGPAGPADTDSPAGPAGLNGP